MNSQAQLSAAQHLASGAGAGMPNLQSAGVGGGDDDDDDIPELEAVEEDGNVDETGVDPKDIELVIQQVGCSRAKAVRVLKESGGDLINASAYPHPSLSNRSILMSPCSHGRERVILLCCTVSLPHCFALSYHAQSASAGLVDDHISDHFVCCTPQTVAENIIIAPNDATRHSSSTFPNRLGGSVPLAFCLDQPLRRLHRERLPTSVRALSLHRRPAGSILPLQTCDSTY